MNRLIILCISILVAQLTYAQQVLFINGDAANPELYIEHGATGFLRAAITGVPPRLWQWLDRSRRALPPPWQARA
jgi:hypothetical protein